MLTYFSWLLIRPGYPICGKCTYWLRFLAMPRVPASCAYTQKWLFVCLTVIFYYFLVNCCINLYMYVCALTNIHMRKGLRNFHTTLLVLRVFFLFLCHTATSCINNIYNTLELSFVVVNMCCIGVYPFAPPGIICRIIK